MAGATMIRNSKLLGVINEIKQYTDATVLFKEKYHYLPGDMPNAESFWGTDPLGCYRGSLYSSATLTQATCNGNGDGRIDPISEAFRAWQQLANAGMLKGQYSGSCVDNPRASGSSPCSAGIPYTMMPGVNVPKSSYLDTVGYAMFYQRIFSVISGDNPALYTPNGNAYWGPISNYRHVIWMGNPWVYFAYGGIVGADALALDTKMDDGRPATGNLVNFLYFDSDGCVTSTVAETATYNLKGNCALIVLLPF